MTTIAPDSTSNPTLAMVQKHGVPDHVKTNFYHLSFYTRKLLDLGPSNSEVEGVISSHRMDIAEKIMFDLMEEGWHPDRIRFLLADIWDAQERSMLAHPGKPPQDNLFKALESPQGNPEANPAA